MTIHYRWVFSLEVDAMAVNSFPTQPSWASTSKEHPHLWIVSTCMKDIFPRLWRLATIFPKPPRNNLSHATAFFPTPWVPSFFHGGRISGPAWKEDGGVGRQCMEFLMKVFTWMSCYKVPLWQYLPVEPQLFMRTFIKGTRQCLYYRMGGVV